MAEITPLAPDRSKPTSPPQTLEPYTAGPSADDVRQGQTLRRGHSGESVMELQRMLNASGADLKVDGLFGPKTEAAVKRFGDAPTGEVGSTVWGALAVEAARSTPRPASTEPVRAPQYGAPAPEGSVTAGSLAREAETRRPQGKQSAQRAGGAPPGYHAMTGRIPTGVVTQAKSLLHHDYGTEIPFDLDGKRYLARLERHYHPPGYVGGPNGWHKGVTVYEAND